MKRNSAPLAVDLAPRNDRPTQSDLRGRLGVTHPTLAAHEAGVLADAPSV